MNRRKFLATSLASAAVAGAPLSYARGSQEAGAQGGREYYELRRYHLLTPQRKLADDYFRGALMPGLNRMGISPVGVFNVSIGPQGPSIYVLMPNTSVETLVTADARLAQDAEYVKAAADFLNAPAKSPAFVRMESSLMQALSGAPKLTIPAATAQHSPRLFELRTYESSTDQDHKAKVAQVNEGEIPIFIKAVFWPVFFSDTLIGGQMPNLTYM
ncbi:MAG: NIPSNAP family protein, partial [Candidatus Acidiferrales bacterium]